MKENYQLHLENTLKTITKNGQIPTLLLHSCCAPCSSYCLEYLSQYFDITIYYYNPNISPISEFAFRSAEQKRLLAKMNLPRPVSFLEGTYEPEVFFALTKGLEEEPEGGERCHACYTMRLRSAAQMAKEKGFDYFTTTLSISPHKNAQVLNEIGRSLSTEYDISYLFSDFKKKDGYRRSCALSEQYQLYRQDYCGCPFSRVESARRKLSQTQS